MSGWELDFHTTLMTLIRLTRNLRAAECEHCSELMTQVYKCIAEDTEQIRRRSNDGQQG